MIPNFTKYTELKGKALVSIVKADLNPDNPNAIDYAYTTKRFDPATGEQLSDEVIGISQKELNDKLADLNKEITNLKAFIADCKAS